MNEEEMENEESKLQKIKKHIKRNKKEYIGAIAGIAVGAAIGYIGYKKVYYKRIAVNGLSAEIGQGHNFGIMNNFNFMTPKKGHPGFPVKCKELNRTWASQGAACKELGIKPSSMSNHMNFKRDHINGLTFERMLPETLVASWW